jgi:hypothetical protein
MKDLNYFKKNAEEDYMKVPISVLRYITELETLLLPQADVSKNCIQFAIWVQDNYSQNKKQGSINPLPKGKMRKDFTDEIYTVNEIWEHFKSR